MQNIYERLISKIDSERVLLDEPMSKHTTFRIGGTADFYINVNTLEELEYVLDIAKKENIQVNIIGNGSNILVKDGGIRGFVLKLNFQEIMLEDKDKIKVGSGVLLSKLSKIALEEELTGLEFASGIPGTIGGAIRMNAGAYGKEICEIVSNVTFLNEKISINTVDKVDCDFGYRESRFKYNKREIITAVRINLSKGNKEEIIALMEKYKNSRVTSQPLNLPSAGSVFKRGIDFTTAKLIDECGLKGYRIGGAEISTKHAGFIVNKECAKAKDVLKLVEYIQDEIQKKYNKKIELEIEVLGED